MNNLLVLNKYTFVLLSVFKTLIANLYFVIRKGVLSLTIQNKKK